MLDTTRVTKNGWKKTYKISPPKPRTTFARVTDKQDKAVVELQEIKKETQDTLENATQEVERLRRGYDDFDTWIKEKIETMQYKSLEDTECKGNEFL